MTPILPTTTREIKLATVTPTSLQPTASPNPTSTPTNLPTSTATYTPGPTNTPRPTLSADEAQDLTLDLLENNADCQLPCWWGFIPGETNWQTAESFLSTFVSKIEFVGSPTKSLYSGYVILPVLEDIYPISLQHVYTIRNDIIDVIDIHITNIPTYSLPQILDTYGKPEEVWVLTARKPREGNLPFDFALFYPQHRFMIDYSVQGPLQGDDILRCPTLEASILLTTWSPEKEFTFAEVINRRIPRSATAFLPLETATGMTIDDFFQVFKETDNSECLKTPSELWIDP